MEMGGCEYKRNVCGDNGADGGQKYRDQNEGNDDEVCFVLFGKR